MKKVLTALLAGGLLWFTHHCQRRIDATPEKAEMVAANPFHKLPPAQYMTEYVGSMLMGGLRAVAIDYLWIQFARAEKARQFREVEAILDTLVRLQPEFAEVWNHLAWSRAYNIAALMETPEERWKWVEQGMKCADEGIARKPGEEKLWFQRGYLRWHRLPQEPYLVDRYFKETGRYASQDAALAFERAIEIAQSQGRDNSRPPCDAMMQESFQRWAFDELRAGNFARAGEILRQGQETYQRLMRGRAVTPLNLKQNAAFTDLAAAFELERQFAARPSEDGRVALLNAYAAIEKEYHAVKAVERRFAELMLPSVIPAALALARRDEAGKAADLIETALVDPCADLSVRADGTVNQFWESLVNFGQRFRAVLSLEADGKHAEASQKLDDLAEEFRYTLPGTIIDALRDRARELRGR